MNKKAKNCLNKENIRKCDERSAWSDCTEMDSQYDEKYRYCAVKKDDWNNHPSCIIEEVLDSEQQGKVCNPQHYSRGDTLPSECVVLQTDQVVSIPKFD